MTRTEGKLEEARFFLGELEKTYYEFLKNLNESIAEYDKPPKCQYYLSAYISAARSVLWIMRSEYHSVKGWNEWYESKKPCVEEEGLLKKMNSVRIRSEKIAPLNLGYNISFSERSIGSLQNTQDKSELESGRNRYRLSFERVLQEGEQTPGQNGIFQIEAEIASFLWMIEEFPNKDILTVCKSYFNLLETVITECKNNFPSNCHF